MEARCRRQLHTRAVGAMVISPALQRWECALRNGWETYKIPVYIISKNALIVKFQEVVHSI